jgi:hypothetical protein
MQEANDNKTKNVSSGIGKWFEELDKFNSVPFLFDREQPTTPERQIFKESDEDYIQL